MLIHVRSEDWRKSEPHPRIQIRYVWEVIGDKVTFSDIHLVPRTNDLLVVDQNYGIQ